MNKDIINRRLNAAKEKIERLAKTVNQEPKEPKQTVNTIPAGVQAHPPVNEGSNQETVPGFITGGPKFNKKMKEV